MVVQCSLHIIFNPLHTQITQGLGRHQADKETSFKIAALSNKLLLTYSCTTNFINLNFSFFLSLVILYVLADRGLLDLHIVIMESLRAQQRLVDFLCMILCCMMCYALVMLAKIIMLACIETRKEGK